MSDHGTTTLREEPFDGAHDAVRDALPALLHGRVTAAERAELDAHVAGCAPCAAELRTLARVRDLYVADGQAGAPSISVDRIAAAVRARTVPALVTAPSAPAWARRGSRRAIAATLLVALGSGAVFVRSGVRAPAGAVASPAAATPSVPAAVADPSGSLLGASFSDLSDAELATVVAAVSDPAAAAPSAEPTPVTPDLAPDAE